MVFVEIPVRRLDDEIGRLYVQMAAIPPGRSSNRLRIKAAIAALEWVRDGGKPPSEDPVGRLTP